MSKRDEISGRLSEAASTVATWRGLMDTPAWKNYRAIIEEQVRLRHATICLTPLSSFGKSLEQEFMKGEAAGLGLALALPETQYEMASLDLERLTVELEKEMDNETSGKSAERSRVFDDDFSRE